MNGGRVAAARDSEGQVDREREVSTGPVRREQGLQQMGPQRRNRESRVSSQENVVGGESDLAAFFE